MRLIAFLSPDRPSVRFRAVALFAALLASCARDDPEPLARRAERVIVGNDDREELSDAPAELAARAAEVSAALIYDHRLAWTDGGGARITAPSAAETYDLCADERFSDQPSAAFCSGVLIDETLLATAAHCLGDDPAATCRQISIVFGFAAELNGVAELRERDVYACRRVVVLEAQTDDYAVIELDRPSSRVALALASERVRDGDVLAVSSHGAGLPLKLQTGALVVDAAPDRSYFVANTDSFAGSSGGALLNGALEWAGMVTAGAADWDYEEGCGRAARTDTSRERHQHAEPVIAGLCARGFPSVALCARLPACGDAVCSAGEACSDDCPPPHCGDSLCEVDERRSCPADCETYASVPPSFPLAPEKYLARHPPSANARHASRGSCSIDAQARTAEVLPWLLPFMVWFWRAKRLRRTAPHHRCFQRAPRRAHDQARTRCRRLSPG